MKILIGDCFHDSDKGGGGIIGGAISTIRTACNERNCSPDISLLFRFSRDDPRFASASRLTVKEFPDTHILPAPISSRRGPGLQWICWVIKILVTGPIRLLFTQYCKHPAIKAMKDADVILFKGGNFYRSKSTSSIIDSAAMLLLFYSMLLAIRLKKKFFVVSHTFGPFYTKSARRIVKKILMSASHVSCREHISKEILIQCGLEPGSIEVTPDFAFATYASGKGRIEEILTKYRLEPCKYVAVTARPWFHEERKHGHSERHLRYVKRMAELCDYIISHVTDKVALVVQNKGSHSLREGDIGPLKEIQHHTRNRNQIVLMDDDFCFTELTGIYGNAFMTIGTRLHSCIFSLSAGTPAIAVKYSHKADGIMHMVNADDYILDIEDLSLEAGKGMIDTIAAHRTNLSNMYLRRVNRLKRELYDLVTNMVLDNL